MLIVPLHRSLGWANFPLMTAALILINCVVFFGPQSRDESVFERAFEYYRSSNLGRIEFPAFLDWQSARARDDRLREAARVAPA